MYSVGRLAKTYGLSRSTLLYYDKINLLKPSGRHHNGYRFYTEADARRLEQVCTYRRAGLRLPEIRRILETKGGHLAEILVHRLTELNDEMQALRGQQRFVVSLLQDPGVIADRGAPMDKHGWTSLLRSAGFSEAEMRSWHVRFEARSPQKHQQFLELLGISNDEIATIRGWSRQGDSG